MERSETQVATSSLFLMCNSPNKMLYDVTFAHRFWHGKHIIVGEQTRLRAFVLVGSFNKVSLG